MPKNTNDKKLGKRVFHLISGETLFGDSVVVDGNNGEEIQIKKPFIAKEVGIHPYMADIMGTAPGAIQIHPMNILWSTPLDEFAEVLGKYNEATTTIIKPKTSLILPD